MMDHENTEKKQGHACGCRGANGGKQHSASESKSSGEGRGGGTALDILDERFARGEIEKAEYEEKKQLISQRTARLKVDVTSPPPSSASTKPQSGSAKR